VILLFWEPAARGVGVIGVARRSFAYPPPARFVSAGFNSKIGLPEQQINPAKSALYAYIIEV
jgi:hypothetical protein